MENKEEREERIKIHEYWMAFRRDYNSVKEGHKPKITHEEVQELIYQLTLVTRMKHKRAIKKAKQEVFELVKEHFQKPPKDTTFWYTEDGWNAFETEMEKTLNIK